MNALSINVRKCIYNNLLPIRMDNGTLYIVKDAIKFLFNIIFQNS